MSNQARELIDQMEADLAHARAHPVPGFPEDRSAAVDLAKLDVFGELVPEADPLMARLVELWHQDGVQRPNGEELLACLVTGYAALRQRDIVGMLRTKAKNAHRHASPTWQGEAAADVVQQTLNAVADAIEAKA